MLPYKITKKYLKGPEVEAAKFDNIANAKDFIVTKLQEDASLRVNTVYSLYDMGELMETFDQSRLKDLASSSGSQDQSSSGQSSSSTQRFSPNPLQTNLRPTGMPPSSFVDDDDKDKK